MFFVTLREEGFYPPELLQVPPNSTINIINEKFGAAHVDVAGGLSIASGETGSFVVDADTSITDVTLPFAVFDVKILANRKTTELEGASVDADDSDAEEELSSSQSIILDAFIYACSKNQLPVVEKRLHQWSVLKPKTKLSYINFINDDGDTALGCAAKNNHPEIVKLLLSEGSQTTLISKTNTTDDAIFLSCKWGRPEILRIILDNNPGIDINSVNEDGETALHAAALFGHHSLLPILLTRYDATKTTQHFVDPFLADNNMRTPLAVSLNGGQSKSQLQEALHLYQTSTYKRIIKQQIDGLVAMNFGLDRMINIPGDVVNEIYSFLTAKDRSCLLFEKLSEAKQAQDRFFFKGKKPRVHHPLGMNI